MDGKARSFMFAGKAFSNRQSSPRASPTDAQRLFIPDKAYGAATLPKLRSRIRCDVAAHVFGNFNCFAWYLYSEGRPEPVPVQFFVLVGKSFRQVLAEIPHQRQAAVLL